MRLPFSTFGEIAALGLDVHVWCCSCWHRKQIDPADARWSARIFAGARFRCSGTHAFGGACNGPGALSIKPREPIRAGSAIEHATLHCPRCLPYWEINDVRFGVAPWPDLHRGERFRCPGCRDLLSMTFHGGPGIPGTDRFHERR